MNDQQLDVLFNTQNTDTLSDKIYASKKKCVYSLFVLKQHILNEIVYLILTFAYEPINLICTIDITMFNNEIYFGEHDKFTHKYVSLYIAKLKNDIKLFQYKKNSLIALTKSNKMMIREFKPNYGMQQESSYFRKMDVVQIDLGISHYVVLEKSGKLFIWGDNSLYQLGLGDRQLHQDPQELVSLNCLSVKCGNNDTLVMTSDKSLYTWGDNCGYHVPTKISFDFGSEIISIGCGYGFNLFLSKNGECYIWLPIGIMNVRLNNIKYISCGYNHVVAISKDEYVYSWGSNDTGQPGLGNLRNRTSPVKIPY